MLTEVFPFCRACSNAARDALRSEVARHLKVDGEAVQFDALAAQRMVVSRFMRKFDSGVWQKSITGGFGAPLGYVWAVGAQRVKGGGSRLSCP